MERVRRGLELFLAIFEPSRELITLDLPTFERPRKATSGMADVGNWSTAMAEVMNLERTRTAQFPGSRWKLQVAAVSPNLADVYCRRLCLRPDGIYSTSERSPQK